MSKFDYRNIGNWSTKNLVDYLIDHWDEFPQKKRDTGYGQVALQFHEDDQPLAITAHTNMTIFGTTAQTDQDGVEVGSPMALTYEKSGVSVNAPTEAEPIFLEENDQLQVIGDTLPTGSDWVSVGIKWI